MSQKGGMGVSASPHPQGFTEMGSPTQGLTQDHQPRRKWGSLTRRGAPQPLPAAHVHRQTDIWTNTGEWHTDPEVQREEECRQIYREMNTNQRWEEFNLKDYKGKRNLKTETQCQARGKTGCRWKDETTGMERKGAESVGLQPAPPPAAGGFKTTRLVIFWPCFVKSHLQINGEDHWCTLRHQEWWTPPPLSGQTSPTICTQSFILKVVFLNIEIYV